MAWQTKGKGELCRDLSRADEPSVGVGRLGRGEGPRGEKRGLLWEEGGREEGERGPGSFSCECCREDSEEATCQGLLLFMHV